MAESATPALDEALRRWAASVDDAIKSLKEADAAVIERFEQSSKKHQAVLTAKRTSLENLAKRIRDAEAETQSAEAEQIEAEQKVQDIIAGQTPLGRLFTAFDALPVVETLLAKARDDERQRSKAVMDCESRLRANPRDRALLGKLDEARKAQEIAKKRVIDAATAVKRAEADFDKSLDNIGDETAGLKPAIDSGRRYSAARSLLMKCSDDTAGVGGKLEEAETELEERARDTESANAAFKPVSEHYTELKKTAARIEAQYKADTGSARLRDDAAAARAAVDEYKPTYDSSLAAKHKAEKSERESRSARDALKRELAKKQQVEAAAIKAVADERAAFNAATKKPRADEEARDKARQEQLRKARENAAAAAEKAQAANDRWYELETEQTQLADELATLEKDLRGSLSADLLPRNGVDALSSLKQALKSFGALSNPSAGDISLVVTSATSASEACTDDAVDSALMTRCAENGLNGLFAQRKRTYDDAAARATAIAWDAAELRDKRFK